MKTTVTRNKGDEVIIIQTWFSISYLLFLIITGTAFIIMMKTGLLAGFTAGSRLLFKDPVLFNEMMKEMGPLKVFERGILYFVFAVVLLFIYYGLCRMVNRTTIRGNRIHITAKHGPLPWPLTRGVKTGVSEIKQFSVQKRVEKTSRSAIAFYRAAADAEKSIPLSAYLEDDVPAKEICRELNSFYFNQR